MNIEDRQEFICGFKDSFPVFLGYLAVAVTLGISASNAGFDVISASLMSFLNVTSAGEAAAVRIIHDHGSYFEIALSQIAINLRYLLMAAALTVKLDPDTSVGRRLLMSLGITDEIFGLSVAHSKHLNAMYTFGGYCMAMPGWVLGTILGILVGNWFPQTVIQALSIGIYVMFIAIIIPPATKSFIYFSIIVISALSSFAVSKLFPSLSLGLRVVILTVSISAIIAAIAPVNDGDEDE